jgi:hypothetical protein
MLYVLSRGHEDYAGGQDEIIHLASSVNTAIALGQPWAFTDRHADLGYASFFSSRDRLDDVDWSVMPLRYWADDATKEKRQAEFLIHDRFPWSAVEAIGVKTWAVAKKVEAIVGAGVPPVAVQPAWYY